MKIIFLDIDGVLNNEIWNSSKIYQTLYKKKIKIKSEKDLIANDKKEFDPRCITLLNILIKNTGAKIVISSTWRKNRSLEFLKKLFIEIGIKGEVIDKTPILKYTNSKNRVFRGNEIHEWMSLNKDKLADKISNYNNYVILDDDSDMLFWQRYNYFRVDSYTGLTPNLIYRVTNFLNKK